MKAHQFSICAKIFGYLSYVQGFLCLLKCLNNLITYWMHHYMRKFNELFFPYGYFLTSFPYEHLITLKVFARLIES